jgi:signal transduction histidine kinase/DNA-binding response OmpR family regulator/streptogramin lyase
MQYTENELLIGSDSGLMMVNTSTLESTPFVNDELNEFSISDRFVYPIYKDREGGVWIGTYYAGINYLAPELKTFTRWRYSRFSNSVGGKIVSGFCEDSKGDIWIALDDGGLNRFSPKTGTFEHVNVGEISKMNIHALCMDGDDLWIGTYANGVFVLNTVTRKLRHYQSEGMNGSLDSNSTYSIFRDRKGNIWVATMEGVNLYNRDTDDFTNVKTFDALTIDIDEDARGRLWFSTQGHGLMAYNPETGIWKNYREDMGGLPHNHVNGVTIDNSGTMWVATANGLCHYVPEKDCFERDAIEVTSQDLLSIVEDQHKLWITTVNGLVRFEPGKGCIIYTTDDGLLSNQFVPNAILKATDGRIYVGSVAGFNAFYPYQIKLNQYQAPVVFTGLDIINKPVSVGDKHLPVPINELDELVLSYEDKVFTIHFAALSYCNPDKNQYSYKLEGFDKDWNFVGDMRQVTYTNLPVGKYKLMVRATNNDGQWSEYTAVLTIKVTPPWWWSLPMKIFYIILVISVLIILIQYLLYRSERHHVAEIKRIEQAKEREVYQAKLSFFTMIAHEIRTPVSLIIGPLEKIMRSYDKLPADVREDLNIINRNNDRLLFLVNQLLDFKKVEQNGLIMRFKHNNLAELMNAVVVRFEPTVEHMGGTLEVHNFASDFVADVDAEAFTKLISNLLNNARKFMTDKIVVDCRVNESAKHFAISVTDNGIGISKENQERIFEPFFQVNDANRASKGGTGIGLSIVKNVVEGHGGTIKVESSEGHGATFTIDFPIHQKNVVASDDDTVDVAETDDKASVDSVTQSGRPVMLVADDNVEMLEFIASSFRGDYEVLTAEDGEEALQLLAENEVSLIVSDWMMPRKNGIEFCKAVRHNAKYSHIPFILLTAKTDNMSKTEGINCGADVYVEKPFSVQYLEACIRNILEMRKLLRQKYSSMPLEPINVIAQTKVDDDFLTKLNEIIEENFSNPDLSVDLLAERLNISRSGLYAKIKALASVSPNELILITRLKKAAQLMKDGQYRVKEICFMVGFNSPSYFAKCFQKQFGMKPTDFVDQC